VSELLVAAIRALGDGPSREGEMRVQEALWVSGDEETIGVLNDALEDLNGPGFERLAAIAEANGSHALVALDLITDLSAIRRGKVIYDDDGDAEAS
jgi:hypothetical protein